MSNGEIDRLCSEIENYKRELLVASVDAESYRRDAEMMAEELMSSHREWSRDFPPVQYDWVCDCPACTVARKYINQSNR